MEHIQKNLKTMTIKNGDLIKLNFSYYMSTVKGSNKKFYKDSSFLFIETKNGYKEYSNYIIYSIEDKTKYTVTTTESGFSNIFEKIS